MQIPTTMKAVHLVAPQKMELVEKPIPKPLKKGQVLIKMAYSPINPSDLAFLTGQYGIQKELPVVPGFEGSGTVVASGGGFYANYLKGKNVACIAPDNGDGPWAEYMLTSATKCVALGKNVSTLQGAMSFVNPLTSVEFADMAEAGGYQAILMSAAASALSKMVQYQAKKKGIAFGGIVRRDEQVNTLKGRGVDFVANNSSDHWEKDLQAWAKNYNKVLFLDAVGGGETPQQTLSALPAHSKMVIYGRLNLESLPTIDPRDFIFNEYEVTGYWLSKTSSRKSFLQILKDTRKVQAMLGDGFETNIQKQASLADFENAVQTYASNMSGGKVLFKMS